MTLIFGIVNVTPDSFSDGGQFLEPKAAIEHAKTLIAQGAYVLDIGGESTRPGAKRPSVEEELERVIPVVEQLADYATISVDTMRAEVAREAVRVGASIINDVSGGLADEQMLPAVAAMGTDYICQHWRGHGAVMNDLALYADVAVEVRQELLTRVEACQQAGIQAERIIIDPGLGFAKTGDQDWQILQHLDLFNRLGYRLLIGASRKRFLAKIVGQDRVSLDAATAVVTSWCAQQNIWAVRTHEVASQRVAIDIAQKLIGTN